MSWETDNDNKTTFQINITTSYAHKQEYVNELLNWEKEIKSKDKEVASTKPSVPIRQAHSSSSKLPIRSASVITTNKDTQGAPEVTNDEVPVAASLSKKGQEKTEKQRIKSYDYKSWDKLDVVSSNSMAWLPTLRDAHRYIRTRY
jgi:hypothetical protein